MTEMKFKQVCKCAHCGNEAEMLISCTLEEDLPLSAAPVVVSEAEGRTPGHSVCSRCGGEADIWLKV
jgi:hypothetical protein